VQPIGYLLAALRPIVAGMMLGATGSSDVVLWFLAGTGLLLAVAGIRVGLPRLVVHEISAWPLPGTAAGRAGSRGRACRSVGGCPHEPRPHPAHPGLAAALPASPFSRRSPARRAAPAPPRAGHLDRSAAGEHRDHRPPARRRL